LTSLPNLNHLHVFYFFVQDFKPHNGFDVVKAMVAGRARIDAQ
jgi:hypothetical protein